MPQIIINNNGLDLEKNDTAKRINEELYFKYILYSCKKIENEISIYCNSFSSKEFYEVE